MFRFEPPFRITLTYIVFGVVWIFWSDKALAVLFRQPEALVLLQTVKGWVFILVTSVFLYVMISRSTAAIRRQEQEKQRVYEATLSAMHHIINNFLNQMLLFRHEAEQSGDFDPEILGCYDTVIDDARQQIASLERVADVSPETIRSAVFPEAILTNNDDRTEALVSGREGIRHAD